MKEKTKSTNSKGLNFAPNFLSRFSKGAKIAAAVVVIVIAILVGRQTLFKSSSAPQYQTQKASRGTLVSSVTASGQVLTSNLVNVTTSASGVVKEVFVKDGDMVFAGQKIMEITLDGAGQVKSAQANSVYLLAKTNVDSTNASAYSLRSKKDTAWKKFYDLSVSAAYQNPDGSPRQDIRNSSAEFQSAQGDWLAAEANYRNQQAVIGQAQADVASKWLADQMSSPAVVAPISGTVGNITFVPGMVLAEQTSTSTSTGSSVGQKVAVVQNSGSSLVTVNLSEVDVTKVKSEQKVTVTLDSIPGKTFSGKVISVDKIGAVSSNVTNYPAIIQIDSATDAILPNMAANVSIIVETKDAALTVPSSAIQTQNGQSVVNVLVDGQSQQVPVETGIASDTQTEIISGLSEGEDVITGTTQTSTTSNQTQGGSPFGIRPGGGGFGGLRPGGFGGGGGGGARRD